MSTPFIAGELVTSQYGLALLKDAPTRTPPWREIQMVTTNTKLATSSVIDFVNGNHCYVEYSKPNTVFMVIDTVYNKRGFWSMFQKKRVECIKLQGPTGATGWYAGNTIYLVKLT